jgi:DNA modification methylase
MDGWVAEVREQQISALTRPEMRRHLREALKAFACADWTFAAERTKIGLHSVHPYPAKFIPQIPRLLLELFHPCVGGAVLDPFCGSGTTLVECQAAGIDSVGVDLNPIAVLLSTVKTHPPQRSLSPLAEKMCSAARLMPAAPSCEIPRVDHWFAQGATTALAKLCSLLGEHPEPERAALNLALSRIIVRASRQESDTRYAAIERETTEEQVYELFRQSAGTLDKAFQRVATPLFARQASVKVLERDILATSADEIGGPFGLVITSPPYPNAYEYWLYHKYRMYWLGHDPIAVRKAEIGARPHYFRKNAATEHDFEEQMSRCFALFAQVVSTKSLVCIVVGRSIIRGRVIDNAALLARAAIPNGFALLARAERDIPMVKKGFNPSHASIVSESILVFGRGCEV